MMGMQEFIAKIAKGPKASKDLTLPPGLKVTAAP